VLFKCDGNDCCVLEVGDVDKIKSNPVLVLNAVTALSVMESWGRAGYFPHNIFLAMRVFTSPYFFQEASYSGMDSSSDMLL